MNIYVFQQSVREALDGRVPFCDDYNQDCIVIINSDYELSADLRNAYVISCGMNNKATFTVSSVECNKAVICLQRNIIDIYGGTIEPQEYAVPLTEGMDIDTFLIFFAVCVVAHVKYVE